MHVILVQKYITTQKPDKEEVELAIRALNELIVANRKGIYADLERQKRKRRIKVARG